MKIGSNGSIPIVLTIDGAGSLGRSWSATHGDSLSGDFMGCCDVRLAWERRLTASSTMLGGGLQNCILAGGIPLLGNVAGVAALREKQGVLMGRSHATTQRRNVRRGKN